MIDFRYHLVSLISVFLALAVGIALGAGPLKETIGDSLTGQVDRLRSEKDVLRTQLDATTARQQQTEAYVAAAGERLVSGVLTDRRVAVVALGKVDGDTFHAFDAYLGDAGASVTAHVTVTPAWTDGDLRSFRQALVGNLAGYLDPVPQAGAGAEDSLAQALVQGLTRAEPTAPDTLAEPASVLLQLLTSGDDPLVTVADPVRVPADALVVLAPDVVTPSADPAEQPTPAPSAVGSWTALLRAAQEGSAGMVLAGGPDVDGSLARTVASDPDLADLVTTVADADRAPGRVAVPLALNARLAGVAGHYGSGADRTVLPEPRQLPPVDRAAAPASPPTEPQG